MNAKDAGSKAEKLLDSPNYAAEHKLDGSRYWALDGRLFSRRLSVNGLPIEKTENVPHISEELKKFPPGTIVDGEIYYPNSNSAHVTSIMGALPQKAVARQALNPIRFAIFDMPTYAGKSITDKPWHERRAKLEQVYKSVLKKPKYIDMYNVTYKDKRKFLTEMLDAGQEGIMLKNVNAPYLPGKRPENNWYKVKRNITDDVVIMGFIPGKGKYEGQIGSIIFGKYDKKGGKLVKLGSCSGITDALRLKITNNPKNYIGSVIEISAMEGTDAGFYRHPRFKKFRVDKGPEQCIINED